MRDKNALIHGTPVPEGFPVSTLPACAQIHPDPSTRAVAMRVFPYHTGIIRTPGLEPWPKLFHNLRASRQTELSESYPMHVVCAWLGNSTVVAMGHYLQVTDAHFEKAALDGAEKATQNPTRYAPESAGIGQNRGGPDSAENRGFAGKFRRLPVGTVQPIDPNGT